MVAGRYRIEGPLGSGGFGTVLRATQLPLGREVAIKIMSSPLGDATRFIQEAQTAQKLEHPNTIRILDFGQLDGGLPFIVFELLRGENLAEFVARSRGVPLWAALRITSQLLKSLMEAHAYGVVHRDIKPANVFVASHPGEPVFVKLLDFGVAKQFTPRAITQHAGAFDMHHAALGIGRTSPVVTRADQIVGTPLYMSPEQASAQPVGPQSDLYAVGLVLAEMVVGSPVLDPSLGGIEIAMRHASPEPLALPSSLTGSPVEGIVRRATAKNPAVRYRSAKEMLADVEQVLAATSAASASTSTSGFPTGRDAVFAPTLVAPFTPRLESKPPKRRATRWIVAGLGSALALALAAGVGMMVSASDDRSRTKSSRADTEDDEEEQERPSLDAKPFRALDLASRELPVLGVDEITKLLRDAGYTIDRVDKVGAEGFMEQDIVSFHKRPCGGHLTYSVFADASLQGRHVETMKAEGMVVETKDRVLAARLQSVGPSPDNPKNCSLPVFALLTKPKR